MKLGNFNGKNAVITGGSTGIGLATAFELASRGANLFLIARDSAKLEKAQNLIRKQFGANYPVQIASADVSIRAQIEGAIHSIAKANGGIHLLVNNAGIPCCGRFEDIAIEDLDYAMRVNYYGAMYATKAAWPYLKSAGGHIGIVSSVAGYTGLIGYSGYAPSKFALAGLAECLRMEAQDDGIGVSVIYPPDADTPFLKKEREHTLPECLALSKSAKVMSAEAVAHAFVRGIEQGKFEILCNTESWGIRILKGFLPRLYFKIVDQIVAQDRKRRGVILQPS